ncbi:MAG TPA: cutinase family protein [Pilimelia sp.]|nr:cutinase family protein [Pilimelia sp.]
MVGQRKVRRRQRAGGAPGRWRRPMVVLASGAVLAGGLAATSSSFAAEAPSSGCADVEIIGARGTTEAPGVGRILQPVAARMTAELDAAVRTTPLDYPASVNYGSSVRQGVDAVRVELAAIAESCPDTAIVLMGYSQGADVMGDVLAAMPTGGSGGAMTRGGMMGMGMGMSRGEMMSRMRERMAARAAAARANGGGMMGGGMMARMRQRLANAGGMMGGGNDGGMNGMDNSGGMNMAMEPGMMQVEAVVLFGDPTFTGGEPFNAGDGQGNGIFARGAGNLGTFADRTISFCNSNDPICQGRGAGGGGGGGGHGDYVKFSGEATEFVAGRV